MKIFKLTYGLIVGAALSLASCNINEIPKFNDADAFVALQQSSAFIDENNEGTLKIPVMLTSLSGISGSVDFTITPNETAGAVEGVNFELLNSGKTLTFTKDSPTQYIEIRAIDNDTFNGDVKALITLTNPQGVELGANKTCVFTVGDDEHPLAFILGDFNGIGTSYWGDELDWTCTFEKDADDVTKVWIYNLVPGGSSSNSPVYGFVNDEKTEIHIPVGQITMASTSYDVILEGFYGEDGEEDIPTGGYITGLIDQAGNITIQEWYAATAYSKGTTNLVGYYEVVLAGAVLKK